MLCQVIIQTTDALSSYNHNLINIRPKYTVFTQPTRVISVYLCGRSFTYMETTCMSLPIKLATQKEYPFLYLKLTRYRAARL